METVGWTMLELGAKPVLTMMEVDVGTGNVGAGTEVMMGLVALTLLMGAMEGSMADTDNFVVAITDVDETEMEDEDAVAENEAAKLEADADDDADVLELELGAEVLPGAWIWPSLIWETVEPTGFEIPNWVEY